MICNPRPSKSWLFTYLFLESLKIKVCQQNQIDILLVFTRRVLGRQYQQGRELAGLMRLKQCHLSRPSTQDLSSSPRRSPLTNFPMARYSGQRRRGQKPLLASQSPPPDLHLSLIRAGCALFTSSVSGWIKVSSGLKEIAVLLLYHLYSCMEQN